MEHVISADFDGVVVEIIMQPGDVVKEGFPILFMQEGEVAAGEKATKETLDPDLIRQDLQENINRHAFIFDENREDAVAKRLARGGRMPRENISELMDEGSFKEYWPLIVARQHQRHDMDTLRKKTPADGVIAGTGTCLLYTSPSPRDPH